MTQKDLTAAHGAEAVGQFLGQVGIIFYHGWFTMMALGVAHASSPTIPALGYWKSLMVAVVGIGYAAGGTAGIHDRIKRLAHLV